MLLGRNRERRRLGSLLTSTRAGTGGALVVRGVPGIGKSSLLASRGAAPGMRVLTVGGRESESTLPFAALRELLDPLLDHLDQVPDPMALAVRSALALGPAARGDRHAVSAGTHALLAAAAAERPVLLLVDDAQWLDAATRSVLAFVGRRLAAVPVAMVVAERSDAPPLLDRGTDVLVLGPLEDRDATALLQAVAPDLAPAARRSVLVAAGGIPLGLRELPSVLTAEERSGRRTPTLPMRTSDVIRDVFERRLDRLGPSSRLALVVVAAAEPPEVSSISDALRILELPVSALEPPETDGLIAIGPERITWSHPLIRSVAYHGAAPASRRRVHRALADTVPDEVRAWHLAAAAIGHDEAAAVALDGAARAAAERLAFGESAAALERAAGLGAAGRPRAARLLAAGASAAAAGDTTGAMGLLDRALGDAGDPFQRAAIEHQRCAVMMATGGAAQAGRRLVRAAEAIVGDRPAVAAVMLADAALAITTDDCAAGLAVAERAASLLTADAAAEIAAPVLAALAWCLDLRGRRADADATHARVARLQPMVDPLAPSALTVLITAANRRLLDDPHGARTMLLGMAHQLREAGALSGVPYPLALVVHSALWTGDWEALVPVAADALLLADETGQMPTLGWALTAAARLAGARGAAERARSQVTRAEALATEHGLTSVAVFAQAARGFLALCLNDPVGAIPFLEAARRISDEVGVREPMMMPFCGDLVDALIRTGRVASARQALDWLDELAAIPGRPWAAGLVARYRGVLGLEPIDVAFERALRLHDTMPFERARTLLAQGEMLRRARRRSDARSALRAAGAGFEELGAAPWAARSLEELRASGGQSRARTPADTLTDAELRVARAVGRGLGNREAAAELFLSPRTVESHLERIYQKLGLRSRAQLVVWVADGRLEPPATGPAG